VYTCTELPIWNFDGSSTLQATGHNSDVYLRPVAVYKDPTRGNVKNAVLVMCETINEQKAPTSLLFAFVRLHV
jgi:glutamine synthetase